MRGSVPKRCYYHNQSPEIVEKRHAASVRAAKVTNEKRANSAAAQAQVEGEHIMAEITKDSEQYLYEERRGYFCLLVESAGLLRDPRFKSLIEETLKCDRNSVADRDARESLTWRIEIMARDFPEWSRQAIWHEYAGDVEMPAELLRVALPLALPKPPVPEPITKPTRAPDPNLQQGEILWTEVRRDL